jgi:hypothetical protein
MSYSDPASKGSALVNTGERISICNCMQLNENPFRSSLQHDCQAPASSSPEQLSEEEDSIIVEIFLNVEEDDLEEPPPFNSENTMSLSIAVDGRPPSDAAGMGAKNAWICRWPRPKRQARRVNSNDRRPDRMMSEPVREELEG